jgi:ATPase subunit of ABC transporter with duplicated ATPase domains
MCQLQVNGNWRGGSIAALRLALLQTRGTTCLVLDEPVNHLDLSAIEQLEQVLPACEGTVVLITHDRRVFVAIRVDTTLDVRDLLTFHPARGAR